MAFFSNGGTRARLGEAFGGAWVVASTVLLQLALLLHDCYQNGNY